MKWTDRKNKGQALLEFTLVALLLLSMMAGIAEWSRYMLTRNLLTGAAREAARAVVVAPGDEAAATARGQALLASAGITTATIAFSTTIEPDGSVTRSAIATYVFQPVGINFIPGMPGNITLTSSTSMRKEF